MRTNRLRIFLPTMLVAVFAMVLAACGGSTTTSAGANPTTTTKPASGAAGFAAYRTCMAKHGVTLPNRPTGTPAGASGGTNNRAAPGSGGGSGGGGSFGRQLPAGVTQQQMDAARQACAGLRPQRSGQGAFNSQAFQAYRSCMADHGVTLPERPTSGTSGSSTSAPPSSTTPPVAVDRSSPAYQAAAAVCRPLLPQGANGSGGAANGSSSTTSAAGA